MTSGYEMWLESDIIRDMFKKQNLANHNFVHFIGRREHLDDLESLDLFLV